jgi:replication factor C subunit 1
VRISLVHQSYGPFDPSTRRVVGQPSSKTNYVVLGDNAGPSKLAAIKKHGLTTLNEDEFLNLIRTRKVKLSDLDEKTRKKRQKEEDAIRQAAKELEQREKGKGKETAAGGCVV